MWPSMCSHFFLIFCNFYSLCDVLYRIHPATSLPLKCCFMLCKPSRAVIQMRFCPFIYTRRSLNSSLSNYRRRIIPRQYQYIPSTIVTVKPGADFSFGRMVSPNLNEYVESRRPEVRLTLEYPNDEYSRVYRYSGNPA